MDLPFTAEQFFDVFRRYNESVWPAQLALNGIALITAAAAYRGPSSREHSSVRDRDSRSLGVYWFIRRIWVPRARRLRAHRRRDHGDRRRSPRNASNECCSSCRLTTMSSRYIGM